MILLFLITLILIFFSGYIITKKFIEIEENDFWTFIIYQITTGFSFLIILYYYLDSIGLYKINYYNSILTNSFFIIIFVSIILLTRKKDKFKIVSNINVKFNKENLLFFIILLLIILINILLFIPKLNESKLLYEYDPWTLTGDSKYLLEYGTYQYNSHLGFNPLTTLKPNGVVYLVSQLIKDQEMVLYFFKYIGLILIPLDIIAIILLIRGFIPKLIKNKSLIYLGYFIAGFFPIISYSLFMRSVIGGVLTIIVEPLFILSLILILKPINFKKSIIGLGILTSGMFLVSLYSFYVFFTSLCDLCVLCGKFFVFRF